MGRARGWGEGDGKGVSKGMGRGGGEGGEQGDGEGKSNGRGRGRGRGAMEGGGGRGRGWGKGEQGEQGEEQGEQGGGDGEGNPNSEPGLRLLPAAPSPRTAGRRNRSSTARVSRILSMACTSRSVLRFCAPISSSISDSIFAPNLPSAPAWPAVRRAMVSSQTAGTSDRLPAASARSRSAPPLASSHTAVAPVTVAVVSAVYAAVHVYRWRCIGGGASVEGAASVAASAAVQRCSGAAVQVTLCMCSWAWQYNGNDGGRNFSYTAHVPWLGPPLSSACCTGGRLRELEGRRPCSFDVYICSWAPSDECFALRPPKQVTSRVLAASNVPSS
jgi:hypothetical protein